MSTFLFLVFLVFFLFNAAALPYTLTGELQSWASGGDFGVSFVGNENAEIFSTTLDLFGKPTRGVGSQATSTIASADSFYSWWNTPISGQSTLVPLSITMHDTGTLFQFSRNDFSASDGSKFFSFHVRGELNCGANCNPNQLQVTTTDDFAMYVNGARVCYNTGTRTSAGTTTCNIPSLTMSSGQWTHYVDIFYARRLTNSPGILNFQLPGSATTCSIFSRSILTRNIYPFGPSNVQPFSNAIFFGNASDPQPVLQLVKESDTSSSTAVYSKTPVRYQNGFSTYFKFNITGASAQGFAFVLQSLGQSQTAGTGAGLGYGFAKSLAIEFDTFANTPPELGTNCDPSGAHVEVHAVFSSSSPNTACRIGGTSGLTTTTGAAVPTFTNGQTYEAYIEYLPGSDPVSGTGTIYVWAALASNGLGKLGAYHASRFTTNNWLVRATFSNANLRSMFGTTTVSAGFTSSTSTTGGTKLYIWDWKFNTVSVGAYATTVSPAPTGQQQVARNTKGSSSLTVTLRDACQGVIAIGTDPVTATLKSGSTDGNTATSDLLTGSYNVWWWHTLAANWNLTIMVYGQSILPGVAPSYSPGFPYNVTIVPDVISAPNSVYTPQNLHTITWLASTVQNVTISARDQFNNPVSTPTTGFQIFFQTFPNSPPISATSQTGSDYLFTIGTHVADINSQIFLRYSGSDIISSPSLPLNITAGVPPDATETAITLIGNGLQGSIAGVQASIDFQLKDTWGNTHMFVTNFEANATMTCAPGFTDPRCNSPTLVKINVVKGKPGETIPTSWFQVQWTTPVVGPCYIVNISIFPATNGINQLPGLPTVCVLPNEVNVTTSIVTPLVSYTAGSFGSLTIQAKDSYNNSRTSDNSPKAPFTVSIGDVSVTCGGASADGTAVDDLACQYAGVGGVYQVTFVPKKSGLNAVVVGLSPDSLSSSITVAPGPGYAPNDNILNLPRTMVAGEQSTIQITSLDKYFNQRDNGSDTTNFVVSMLPTGSSSGSATVGSLIPRGPGLYDVTLSAKVAGGYDVSVKLLGAPVNNSMANNTFVFPNLTNLTVSVASGSGLFGGIQDAPASFVITAYDNYENIQNHWTDVFACEICTQTCGVKPCSVTGVGGGIWTVNYTSPVFNFSNPTFTLKVYTESNSSGLNQTRSFPMSTSDTNSALHAILQAMATPLPTCPFGSTIPYQGLNNTLTAGQPAVLYLFNYGTAGCTDPLNKFAQEPAWNVEFNSLIGSNKFSGTVTNDTLRTTNQQAIYNVTVLATKVGTYKANIRGGPIETEQSKGGVYTNVVPGPLDPPSCLVTPAQGYSVAAGTPVTFNITLRDAYGNNLVNAQGLDLEVVIRNQAGVDVTTTRVENLVETYDPSAPYVTISFAPNSAGVGSLSISGPSASSPGTNQFLASRTFPIVVSAGPVNEKYTCFFTPMALNATANPPPCVQPALTSVTATAGQPYTVSLYARDKYNNPVNNGSVSFDLTLQGQTIRTVSSEWSGGQGLYFVSYQANKTVGVGELSAATTDTPTDDVATGQVKVDPAELSNVTSYVTGLNSSFVAGGWVNWTLVARDLYNNEWFSTQSASLQIDVSLEGPEPATKAILSTPTRGYIASSSVNPNANYRYQYIPETASTNNLPTVETYTAVFRYNGVELQNLEGNVPFLVYPAVPDAVQTGLTIPQIQPSSAIPAGELKTLRITLRDRFGNRIINGSDVTQVVVGLNFYNGPGTQCLNAASINTSKLVTGFTNRRGYIHLDDDDDVTDLGDGTYNLTIWTVVAGPYFAGITVNDVDVQPCRQITTVFEIVALEVNGTQSELFGPAIDAPVDNLAGTKLEMRVLLRDKYENIVNKRGLDLRVGAIPVSGTIVGEPVCGTDLSFLQNGGVQFPTSPPYPANPTAYFENEDNKNGTWTLRFEVYRADNYHVVIYVNSSATNYEEIGNTCHNLTVIPWYVYSWVAPPPSNNQEALTTSLVVQGKDKFSNNVTKGEHYWKLVYRRTDNDILAPYGFARDTEKFEPYSVSYSAEHYGGYTAYVTLVQDPKFTDTTKFPVATSVNDTIISITPATCNRETNTTSDFRCPAADFMTLGSCQASWSGCGGASSTESCPGSATKCQRGNHCADNCAPVGASSEYPSWAIVNCNGEFRFSAAECPSERTCPQTWMTCADGRSCSKGVVACPSAPAPCPGGYQCANGACVKGKYDCPTDVTCSTPNFKVCQDGTCVASELECPSLFGCASPNTARCSDGSCRRSSVDCPSGVTCPPGFALCETGHCVKSISECQSFMTECAANQVHCADGTCRDNLALCPSSITCPAERPVLCPDRSCVGTVALCKLPMKCTNASMPYLCPGGSCAYAKEECPTFPTCPLDTPVLCEDQTCAETLAMCNPRNLVSAQCPAHRPYNCPDGSCANSLSTCPTLGVCTPDTPVRCTSAGCAVAGNVCPLKDQLACTAGVLCPGGGCAIALSQCPTAMTCPPKYERCSDGSCRSNCTGIMRKSSTYCTYPQYECPGHEGGFSCVENPKECPQSPTCPFDRPIRCVDRSCAASEKLCKPAPVYAAGYSTCAANTFITSPGSCESSLGTGSTTCPSGWVKCWDETCRHIAEDCPPEPLCTINHPNPRFVAPYLCSDGNCARNLYKCGVLDQCPSGQIRCPVAYAEGPDSDILCAPSLAQCANITAPSIPLVCPHNFELCSNGACRTSCETGFINCPSHLPFQCNDGKCVTRPTLCAPRQVCGTNFTRCWDKTCPSSSSERCTAKSVGVSFLNVCPISTPFRCPNGYCSTSSALCPGVPQERSKCPATTPVLCADGSCQMNGIQCPVIKPCFGSQVRCPSGVCAAPGQCPSGLTDVCASGKFSGDFMCPNGVCAASNSSCWNEKTGCFGNMTKCDDGLCADTCSQPKPWHGCETGTRCYDGSCSTSCLLPTKCYPGDPTSQCEFPTCGAGNILCANGDCVASGAAASCKTAWNCPIDTPFRGVDGTCNKYPADGESGTIAASHGTGAATAGKILAQGTVVCSSLRPHVCKDGSCVAHPSHCPAIQPCPNGLTLCRDMTCAATCPTIQCPPNAPALCPDGSCRISARQCGPLVLAPKCASPMFQCFDGYCAASSLDCIRRQYAFSGKTFNNNSDHGTGACDSGEYLCWNGACLINRNTPESPTKSDTPAHASVALSCPALPGCPIDYPLRCWDGSCIKNGTQCPTSSVCSPGSLERCEDGTCRSKGSCPQYQGCPQDKPFFCAYAVEQCVANAGLCLADPADPQVCASDCVRDGIARSQRVTVSNLYPTVIDAVLDSDSGPTTQIIIPAGSFVDQPATIVINPATFQDLQNGRARINSILVPRTPAQILLSPPFYVSLGSASSNAPRVFNMNITVTSTIDTTLYAGSSSTGTIILTNPCQLVGTWQGSGTVGFVSCVYTLTVTNTTTTMYPDYENFNDDCPEYGFVARVSKVNATSDPIEDTQTICVCSNVTSTNGSFATPVQSTVCVLWYLQGETGATAIFQNSPTSQGICPDRNGADIFNLPLIQIGSTEDGCSGSGAGLIPPNDICLCYFNPSRGREWKCFYEQYHDRINNPPWTPDSGRPNYVVSGKMPWNQVGLPVAMCYIPLPQPPLPITSEESWWEKYGKIVLGVGISMFILLLILACAISRLIRYRKKYHEERAEAEELREQAQELDEKHGGLGVYDDEVEMMANPLVVEMQELQKQLEQTNAHLKTQEEMDEMQMGALDKERQRILEEIKRVKDAIAAQAKTNPTRVDEIPPSGAVAVGVGSSGATSSSGTGAERQDFGQAPAARRKKQDM